jgi:hypothetical protein
MAAQEHIDVSDVLDQVGEVLSGLVEGSSASSHASDSALPNLWSQLQSIKQRVDDNFTTLAVMALAKSGWRHRKNQPAANPCKRRRPRLFSLLSPAPALPSSTPTGKSTLINGLMGKKLLPSNNVPETARITSIEHQPPNQPPALTYQAPDGQTVTIQGTAQVHEHLRQLNSAARGGEQGLVASEQPLRITAAIAALVGLPTAALGGRISILDTPGGPRGRVASRGPLAPLLRSLYGFHWPSTSSAARPVKAMQLSRHPACLNCRSVCVSVCVWLQARTSLARTT